MGEYVRGIDISHWQTDRGRPDWAAASRQGYEFVYIKATEGATYQDPGYRENHAGARNHGFWAGAYHLIRLDTPDDAEKEGENFLNHATFEEGDLPPAIDVEHRQIAAPPPPDVDVAGIITVCQVIREGIAGIPQDSPFEVVDWPALYLGPRGLKKLGEYAKQLSFLITWICDHDHNPTDEVPDEWKDWTFWQWSSKGDGRAAGFKSDHLDLDLFNGSKEALAALANRWFQSIRRPPTSGQLPLIRAVDSAIESSRRVTGELEYIKERLEE